MKKNLSYSPYLYSILGLIILIIIVYLLYSFFKKPSLYYYNNMKFKEYSATSPYADVIFKGNDKVMYITVKYKNLRGVSAIHIHVNNNGKPGPILAWLGTTTEWQNGVAQNATNANSPCSTKSNPKSILASPTNIGTPYLNELTEYSEKTFVFYNENKNPGKCPWIQNGTLLDIHGFNFQQKINGKLTSGKPGADIIYQSVFYEK